MGGIQRFNKQVVLAPLAARTTSANGSTIVIPDGYTRVRVVLTCTAASGTSPTLNVYIQDAMTFAASGDLVGNIPTGVVTFNDVAAFTQITGVTTRYIGWVETGTFENAAQAKALTAGTVRNGPIGNTWRAAWTMTATTPSFTFAVVAEFLP